MKESDITVNPDGTILRKFINGFVFEGYADEHYEPISGVLKTPKGVKYDIPDFKGEYIYNVFEKINAGQLDNYKRKEEI